MFRQVVTGGMDVRLFGGSSFLREPVRLSVAAHAVFAKQFPPQPRPTSAKQTRIAFHAAYNEGQVSSAMKFTRITVDANKMGGVPCVRGLRVPVATVVAMVADGMNERQILEAYPYLEAEDIKEAIGYAAEAARERAIPATS